MKMRWEMRIKRRLPVAHRILVQLERVDDGEQRSAGGIITRRSLTDSELQRDMAAQEEGTVVAIGPTAFKDFGGGEAWCKEGDKVFIVRYSGTNFVDKETGDMFRIINDEDIYAIIQEDKVDE